MQHVGDDGLLEGEHDVGGSAGESVTPRSRLRGEMNDVRQSGASQTETIDGLDCFKAQAYDHPQADNRAMLIVPAHSCFPSNCA
jgi:hypothetical protein